MSNHLRGRSLLFAGAVVAGLLAFSGIASGTFKQSSSVTYRACVPKSGVVRMITAGHRCKSSERLISWSQSGKPGTHGIAGTRGLPGKKGAAGTGSTGLAGATGATGTAGAAGADGSKGSTGNTGATGATGATGNTGAAGNDGSPGTAGTPGAAGSNGTNGTNGSNGVSGYGFFYNAANQNVALGANVVFDTNGPASAGIVHVASSSVITVSIAGVYEVSFVDAVTGAANQMTVTLNGAAVPGAVLGSGNAGSPYTGQVVFAAAVGGTISLKNIGTAVTGANASITVEQIG